MKFNDTKLAKDYLKLSLPAKVVEALTEAQLDQTLKLMVGYVEWVEGQQPQPETLPTKTVGFVKDNYTRLATSEALDTFWIKLGTFYPLLATDEFKSETQDKFDASALEAVAEFIEQNSAVTEKHI